MPTVAVISQSADEVRTLVFLDTLSYRAGSKQGKRTQSRIQVIMVEQEGTWLIDDLQVPQA
jgi:hypothetical protein